jgi:hypothetical protein
MNDVMIYLSISGIVFIIEFIVAAIVSGDELSKDFNTFVAFTALMLAVSIAWPIFFLMLPFIILFFLLKGMIYLKNMRRK